MSARFLVLAFLVAAPSAFAMGHWQGEHAEPEDDLAIARLNAPIITRPGTGAADAVRYLAGVTTPVVEAAAPVAPGPVRVSTTPVGPPPEDVSVQFRRDVTAVLTNGEPHIVLAGGRRIGRGEVYQDGWRVSDISSQRAVLARGRETRSVDLFSAPPMQSVQMASAPVLTGPVAFSNGLLPDQRAGQAARIPVQTQQMELLQQLRDRAAARQRGGGGNDNNGGRRGQQQAGPNGGFGGGFGAGGFGGGRRGQPQAEVRAVVIPPPPPPPPSSGGGEAD